ncbi:MAG: hypothetical protein KAI75_00430 [Desulfobulbaceae bacterium]|nr:hypothetical protein [Desulfobulbaceae bacterium]MCK5403652.1 hypothetical protein [Desulfobulbaceae bacterium]
MIIVKFIDFFRDRLKGTILFCYGVLALLVFIDLACIDKSVAHTKMEHLPGFWSLFGFIACVAIIIISKWFGHSGIMTREDYYDD